MSISAEFVARAFEETFGLKLHERTALDGRTAQGFAERCSNGRDAAEPDLDIGAKVKRRGDSLTDVTYAQLLAEVTRLRAIPVRLQEGFLEYYSDPNAPIVTKKNPAKWAEVQVKLERLRGCRRAILLASHETVLPDRRLGYGFQRVMIRPPKTMKAPPR